jgi:hypothetical protein
MTTSVLSRVAALLAVVVLSRAEEAIMEADASSPGLPSFDPGRVVTVRLQLPATGFIRWRQDGGFTLSGVSASTRFARLIEAEAGATLIVNPCADGMQFTLRAGLSPSVVTARARGTHWNVRLPLLASAHMVSVSGDGCDGHTESSGKPLTLAFGIDATHWSAAGNTGLNLRLLAGVGEQGWSEAALTLGVSFR